MNSLSGKSILLTGATGFIGRHLAARLRQIKDIRLILFARNGVDQVESDSIWLSGAMDQLTRQYWVDHGVENIDIVFHLGAFTPKNSSEGAAVNEIFRDNLVGTRALLESLPRPPRKIVFSSTLDVYAPPEEGHILTEKSPLAPTSLYGASKLFCEYFVKDYSGKHECGYAILRYGHIYGPGEGAYAKLIPQVIRALLRNENPVIHGDGRLLRDYMFVGDVVEATIRAGSSQRREIGPLNIVSGESRSIREIVETLLKMTGVSGEIKSVSNNSKGRSLQFNNVNMFNTLGRWDLVPLQQGLQYEIDYFKENP